MPRIHQNDVLDMLEEDMEDVEPVSHYDDDLRDYDVALSFIDEDEIRLFGDALSIEVFPIHDKEFNDYYFGD